MFKKIKIICLVTFIVFLSGCSSYSVDDYGEADNQTNETSCINMEPAQEAKCKERENELIISIGADANCNHPYEYERNRCMKEKAKKQRLLDESLKKHNK